MGQYEEYGITHPPFTATGYGGKYPWGTFLPPGGNVAAFVRSTGQVSGDSPYVISNLVTTLSAGLHRCRSGCGDIVVVLPGHTESVADALMFTYLVAGTTILGIGKGSAQPVFRWTATTSQWILNKADVTIQGLRLRMEGANGVVKALAWTGADCTLSGCDIELASGAALKATIGIELATGATRATVSGNRIRGSATHNVTDGILIANAIDGVTIVNNVIQASATAARGLVHIAAAATQLYIARNRIYNTHTASTGCIVVDNVAADGLICDNYCGTLNDGVATAQGIILGAGALTKQFQNFSGDEPLKSGILTPAVVAT
jgi:hypothetical protein